MADQEDDLNARAAAWGMSPLALANLLKCGKGAKGIHIDPENHHLRFEGEKIFLRVRIKCQSIEERLPSDLAKAREARDKRLLELGFNYTLFIRNQSAYNASKRKK